MCTATVRRWSANAESYLDKHPRIGLTVVAFAVSAFAFYLGVKTELAIAFAVLSIAVATFFPTRALRLSRDSLTLTRNTLRPFVTVTNTDVKLVGISQEKAMPAIWLTVRNTGSLPAQGIHIKHRCTCKADSRHH